jgi:hypothetical protein
MSDKMKIKTGYERVKSTGLDTLCNFHNIENYPSTPARPLSKPYSIWATDGWASQMNTLATPARPQQPACHLTPKRPSSGQLLCQTKCQTKCLQNGSHFSKENQQRARAAVIGTFQTVVGYAQKQSHSQ